MTGLRATPIGERYSFSGKHYTLRDSPALPKPVQRSVPLIMGGNGKVRTPSLAARYAGEFNVGFCSPPEARSRHDRVRAACGELGRDPAQVRMSWMGLTLVGRNDAEVARRAAAIGRDLDEVRESGLTGTPQQVVDRLGAYQEAGTDRLYLQILDLHDLAHLDLIAAEVLPAIATRAGRFSDRR